jgi:RNA polymerase sigma factor (sigma-70 family)
MINELLQLHNNYIWKLIHQYNKYNYPLEDLYQEAVIGFIEGINNYDKSKSPKLMYYCSFYIKRRLFQYFKTNKPFETLDLELINSDSPEIIISKIQLIDKSLISLDLLNEREKYILSQIYLKEYSQQEVAQFLKISPERVRQIKEKGLTKLKNMI